MSFADVIFKRTYAIDDSETWEQCARRVSKFVSELSKTNQKSLENQFYEIISTKKFIPGGRYLYSAGRTISQINNCFLLKAEDSREGWAKLVSKHILALSTGGGVGTEYSSIREKGAIISRFGGTASGPVSLMSMVNEVARQVMAGGKRRSALWAGLNWQHPDIEDFLISKNWSLPIQAFKEKDFNFPAPLDMTNISVGLDDDFFKQVHKDKNVWDFYYRVCKSMCKTGEPGFSINVGDRSKETLRNPCQPSWAPVLTPEGIRTFNDIDVGSTIWSGKQWTKVTKKWNNGIKPIYAYFTTAGYFIGTDTHKIVQCGEKVPVKEANGIDITQGSITHTPKHNPQDVMDGLVLGDGSVHKASNNLVYLIIGDKDTDYLESEIKHLLKEYRPGLNPKAWEIHTTVTPQELPRTWNREVPDRFYYGSTEKVKGFLRGLFSANGSVKNSTSQRICLKQSSNMLVRQVQQMLSSIGISSYITTNKPSTIKHKNGEYISKESYELNIGDIETFLTEIGFLQKYKTFDHPKKRKNPKITFDINQVEFLGEDEVFDIEVEAQEHTYWSGGLLVSNCTEVVSDTDSDCCNLGSVNLSRINDIEELRKVTALATTFLYLGTHVGYLPHEDFAAVREKNRRIGLGLMGLHEWCLKNGQKYEPSEKLGEWLDAWKEASDATAKLDYQLSAIGSGIRPIAVRACAPTGTIGIIGETSTGMEPIFCVAYKRRFLDNGGKWKYQYVIDPTAERLVKEGVDPDNIEDSYSLSHNIERRIAMQAFVQEYIDQGISSTINVPSWGEPGNNNCKQFAEILLNYLPKLRGITLYPEGARSGQPLTPVKYETAMSHKDVLFEEDTDRCAGGVCGL